MANTYESYKDSGIAWIGEIPSDWEVSRYKFYTTNRMGETILASDTTDDGVPIYSATQDNSIFGYIKNPKVILGKGDIVIPARGNSIGYATFIEDDVATCSQTTICSTNIHNIDKKFLFHCIYGLKDDWFRYDGSAIPQITVDQVKNNFLPLPSKTEQDSIASYLDSKCLEIDSLISLQEEMISELQAYKQSVITEAVTKGLDPNAKMKDSGVEWIGEIPEGWSLTPIKYLKSNTENAFVDGPFGSNLKSQHFIENGDVYVIESGFITTGKFVYKPFKEISFTHFETIKRSECKAGDIIIAKIGAKYGMGAELPCLDKPSVVSGNSLKITLNNNTILNSIFVYLLMTAKAEGGYRGLVQENAQPALSLGGLNNFKLPIAPLEEQVQIAEHLDTKTSQIDSLISLKQQKIQELKDYKKSIIYEYVTGKKRVI